MTHNTLVKNELGKKLYVRSKASFKNENTKKKKMQLRRFKFPSSPGQKGTAKLMLG